MINVAKGARILTVFSLIIILALSGGPISLFAPALKNSQAQSSCPASDTLHITEYSGVPASFNTLSVYNPSGYAAAYLAYAGAGAPLESVGGIPYNYTTVFDSESHNANYTVWTFHIRSGETWSNGQPVTSQDVVNEWNSSFALNPSIDPTFPPLHSEIVSVVPTNASTVTFNLNMTDAHLDVRMSPVLDTLMYPSQITKQGNPSFNGFGTNVSEGPFYIDNYQAGSSSLVMRRNPYFKPQPTVCEIDWNFIENIAQTPTYLAAGSTDLALIPSGAAATLATLPNIKVLNQADELITFLEYNQTLYPFNMTQFRQALVYGINETAISSIAYSGYAHTAYSSEGAVPPSSRLYNPNQVQYSYNTTKALSLLATMGITKGSDGMLHYSNGTTVSIGMWADNDLYSDNLAAPLVEANLRSLGFQVNLQVAAWNTMTGYGFSNTFGIDNGLILHTSNALYPGDPYVTSFPINFVWALFWLPTQPELVPASANAQFLSNFSAIEATADPSLEAQYSANIQALNSQYLPAVPLTYDDNLMAYSTAHFTGWPSSPNGYMWPAQVFWNLTAIEALTPVGSGTTTSSATTGASSSGATSTGATTSGATTTSTTTTTSGGTDYLPYVAAIVVVVIVVAVAVLLLRRRPST